MTATTLETVFLNTVAPIPCQVASVEIETVSTTQTPSVTNIAPIALIVMPTPTKTLMHSGQATELHILSSGKFDGTETADTGSTGSRTASYKGTRFVLKNDTSLCMHVGFCGNEITTVWKMLSATCDSRVRGQLMAMVERCPSATLSYSLEPDLPVEIVVTPDGALWFSGGITVERSYGQPFEARNRATLCRCGNSKNKSLCDGTQKEIGFSGYFSSKSEI